MPRLPGWAVAVGVGVIAGVALDLAFAFTVLTFGPESLLDFGEAAYGAEGKYVPR